MQHANAAMLSFIEANAAQRGLPDDDLWLARQRRLYGGKLPPSLQPRDRR